MTMELPLPSALSPSRMSSFTSCALAFRLANIDRLPEESSEPAVLGTTVHLALERLFAHEGPKRTREQAEQSLTEALAEMKETEDFIGLELAEAALQKFTSRATSLVDNYFEMEDPTTIVTEGLELKLDVELGGVRVRGIIDRLDRTPEGELIVVDYKTGRPPSKMSESARLTGVTIYAAMVEQVYGKRPIEVQLLYLAGPLTIATSPSPQKLRGVEVKIGAVWNAIERSCKQNSFKARKSPLCNWCSFQEYCPEFGGDLDKAWEISLANPANQVETPAENRPS